MTLYLVVGGYCMNGWESGAVISFLHDASDVSTKLAKGLA